MTLFGLNWRRVALLLHVLLFLPVLSAGCVPAGLDDNQARASAFESPQDANRGYLEYDPFAPAPAAVAYAVRLGIPFPRVVTARDREWLLQRYGLREGMRIAYRESNGTVSKLSTDAVIMKRLGLVGALGASDPMVDDDGSPVLFVHSDLTTRQWVEMSRFMAYDLSGLPLYGNGTIGWGGPKMIALSGQGPNNPCVDAMLGDVGIATRDAEHVCFAIEQDGERVLSSALTSTALKQRYPALTPWVCELAAHESTTASGALRVTYESGGLGFRTQDCLRLYDPSAAAALVRRAQPLVCGQRSGSSDGVVSALTTIQPFAARNAAYGGYHLALDAACPESNAAQSSVFAVGTGIIVYSGGLRHGDGSIDALSMGVLVLELAQNDGRTQAAVYVHLNRAVAEQVAAGYTASVIPVGQMVGMMASDDEVQVARTLSPSHLFDRHVHLSWLDPKKSRAVFDIGDAWVESYLHDVTPSHANTVVNPNELPVLTPYPGGYFLNPSTYLFSP